jgi:phosphohistidine phosphatase
MPDLILMRHAKSAWDNDATPDFDRPLAPRGRRDAKAMSALVARDFRPDRILCSPSRRTRETLALLTPALGEAIDVVYLDALYDHPGDYTDVIAAHGGQARRLMVLGHNPAIQATALALVAAGDDKLRSRLHAKYPTSAVAVIGLPGPWPAIAPLSGRLVAFVEPGGRGRA